MLRSLKRRRATVILEYSEGILITAPLGRTFVLPGGAVERGEADRDAAVRELREETGLVAERLFFLFAYESTFHHHQVFWACAQGIPHPQREIRRLAYYRAGARLLVSPGTRAIVKQFYTYKKAHPDAF